MAGKPKDAPGAGSGAAIVVADRVDLLCAAQVASVVERRSTIPVLENMVVEAAGDILAMVATDLDMDVRVEVPARTEGATLATTVDAARLAGLIGASDDGDQITLAHEPGGRDVVITTPRSKYKLPVIPRADFPMIAFEAGPMNFRIGAKMLASTLSRTATAECDEQVRYYLCGTALAALDDRLLAIATNGHLMAEIDLAEITGAWPTVILPSKLTRLMARLLKDVDGEVGVALNKDETRIRFEWANWAVTSKLIDGQFPDWRRVIPPLAPKRRLTIDSEGLRRAIGRVAQMSGEKTRVVTLDIAPETVTVACRSSENGEAEEVVAAEAPFGDFHIAVNAVYLRDIAASASGDTVTFEFGETPTTPIRVAPQAGGGFVGVIMPLRP